MNTQAQQIPRKTVLNITKTALFIGMLVGAIGVFGAFTGYGIELTGDGWAMQLLGQ